VRRKDALIAEIVALLPEGSFQERPYYPNLLNQPALLIVPEPGKLVTIHFYDFHERVTWHAALGALEDLFEVKTTVGPYTKAVAIVNVPEHTTVETEDMIRLLANSFDAFLPRQDRGSPRVGADLLHGVSDGGVREGLLPLWLEEGTYQRSALSREFDEDDLALLVNVRQDRPGRSPELKGRALELLRTAFNEPVSEGRLVDSVKSSMGDLSRSYRFKFDFMVSTHPPVVVDVVTGKRFGMRERLRYMMAKARLIRYWVGADGIRPRQPDYRPLALVSGTLAGPDHDPYRYVRALRSVGWEVAHEQDAARLKRIFGS
jgi:hypothetical protein